MPILKVEPFDLVVFGGNGDLALRKLLPALYHRERDGQLPQDCRIIGAARTAMSSAEYAAQIEESCRRHVGEYFDDQIWTTFRERLHYAQVDGRNAASFRNLAAPLGSGEDRARIFYLATSPDLFGSICHNVQAAGLITPHARVVLEKPLGHDLESSRRINDEVGAVFPEDRIFRIDHYLGKETVQNLMVLRFANTLFEPVWHAGGVDHVQITVAETLGVEGRGPYYESAGALRDMVQNHLLQLLCLVAMEPPAKFDADGVRDEKLKVLKALTAIEGADVPARTVRGQYRAGAIDGAPVPAYADEIGKPDGSPTETMVVLKAEVANWRWAGVPFYLRSGKRLPTRGSEIVVQFRQVPHLIFPENAGEVVANRLVIRLQPDEGVKLTLMTKEPGPGGLRMRSAPLNLSFAETFKTRYPDAYERLLMDVVRGNTTLFMRRDEVEAAWRWIEPILDGWDNLNDRPKPYAAGTWGPSAAIALIERDGRTWHDDMV